MVKNNEAQFVKDVENKRMMVVREFSGSLEQVWNSWTESNLLDLWWAADPCNAKTMLMDFREGGFWLYHVTGPDNLSSWARVDFVTIELHKSLRTIHSFCDENGDKNNDLPEMDLKIEFTSVDAVTKVKVEISFKNEADIKQLIGMGFQTGFIKALDKLETLVTKTNI